MPEIPSRKLEIPRKHLCKMGTIKDRNNKDLIETKEIKKRWQGRRIVQKKCLNVPDNHDGVVTYREPGILEYEVKWALGSITMNKASESDGIPAELFLMLKTDVVEVLYSV